ncbi:MAG: ASKHA domain-containing protein, partial [Anaerolineae bacterium]|nr:ASKHA domain-containing protein [Anaerolineae bacterium]
LTHVLGDVQVDVPPSSMTAPQRVQVEGLERVVDLDPYINVYQVAPEPPSLEDMRADATRLRDALRDEHNVTVDRFDSSLLKRLSNVVRENDWKVRIVTRDGEAVAITDTALHPLGLAVDIGTTKIAAYVVDLETGVTVGSAGVMNPQIAYGEDVMARITYVLKNDDGLEELQQAIVGGLNALVDQICRTAGRKATDVVEAVLVGNTCMHHLVLGLPVAQMGLSPYLAALSDPYDLKARDIGLRLSPGAGVHLLPNIAGFVGADHVSFVLAADIHNTDKVTVGLDIGTNTEISLAAHGQLWCCSTASGPAFEGAHIKDGMRAAPGAIEWIRANGNDVAYQTIGDAPPVGICGSGILDGVAVLRQIGVVRANGAMKSDSHPRVRRTDHGVEFVLVREGERGAPQDVVITRRDVNEIQLAKSAMRTGVEILLQEAGLKDDDIEQFIIAGAFGTYLDVGSAIAIGMFPALPRERFVQVGNAAGTGARLALLSHRCRESAAEFARRMKYVELTTHPQFLEAYTSALMLP